ncbi:hypothetical protein B0H14DRAFT_2856107 [Mycena olivaceomarginata]|nr:hypothetical protein B0H14DRAFT_2856107 [Mycena olivaceomarginata]
MEPSRPAAQEQGGKLLRGASSAPSTESQLVALLSESRREAQSLRQERELVRRKADADHRQLQALSRKSPDQRSSRIPGASCANWLQVERYLIIMQNQAADSRAAFSRLMEEQDGRLLEGATSLWGTIISSSRSGHHNRSHSNHRRHSPSSLALPSEPRLYSPVAVDSTASSPSPPVRSPLGVEDGRWHAAEREQRASGRDEFQPGSSRSPSPLRPATRHPSPPPPAAARNRHDPERARHPDAARLRCTESPAPIYPAPAPAGAAASPHARPAPLQARLSGVADAPAHQYQHRFHLNAGVHGPRRPVRPGAYETVVFALDSDAQSDGVGRVKEE